MPLSAALRKRVNDEIVNACPTQGRTQFQVVDDNVALRASWLSGFAAMGQAKVDNARRLQELERREQERLEKRSWLLKRLEKLKSDPKADAKSDAKGDGKGDTQGDAKSDAKSDGKTDAKPEEVKPPPPAAPEAKPEERKPK